MRPRSSRARGLLDESMRRSILTTADPDLLPRWLVHPCSAHDLAAARALVAVLPVGDPRRAAASASAVEAAGGCRWQRLSPVSGSAAATRGTHAAGSPPRQFGRTEDRDECAFSHAKGVPDCARWEMSARHSKTLGYAPSPTRVGVLAAGRFAVKRELRARCPAGWTGCRSAIEVTRRMVYPEYWPA
jgi:hypothetical protein